MKKSLIVLVLPLLVIACNNDAKDSVEKADSTNEAKEEKADSTGTVIIRTDEESTDFLVKAADGSMAEVRLGELAQRKGIHAEVKKFGAMMVTDHTAANNLVKSLAVQRNVTLPAALGEENQKLVDDLAKKSGKEFDKAYIDAMVKDHQEDISMFEKASGNVKDIDIKNFIDNTLPTLRKHLENAKAAQKAMK